MASIKDFNPIMLEKFRAKLEKKLGRSLTTSEALDLLNELAKANLSEDPPKG